MTRLTFRLLWVGIGAIAGGISAYLALDNIAVIYSAIPAVMALVALSIPVCGIAAIIAALFKPSWLLNLLAIYAVALGGHLLILLAWGKFDVWVFAIAGMVPVLIAIILSLLAPKGWLNVRVGYALLALCGSVLGSVLGGWLWGFNIGPVIANAETYAQGQPYCAVDKKFHMIRKRSDLNRLKLLGQFDADGYDGFHLQILVDGPKGGSSANWANRHGRFERLPDDHNFVVYVERQPCDRRIHFLRTLRP